MEFRFASPLKEEHIPADVDGTSRSVIDPVTISTNRGTKVDPIPCPQSEFPFGFRYFYKDSASKCSNLRDIWDNIVPNLNSRFALIGFGGGHVVDDVGSPGSLSPEFDWKATGYQQAPG